MQNIDTIIQAPWIIPITPDDQVLEGYSLAIHQGRIIDCAPTEKIKTYYQGQNQIEFSQHALMPGFINAHTHSPMSLLRGLADDLPLMEWLNDHIWPAEAKWISETFIRDGALLAIAEMLRGGITCFNDMYFFPEVVAQVAAETGIRAVIGMITIDFPSVWAKNPQDYIRKGLELNNKYQNHPLIKTALAPHAPYTVSDKSLMQIAILAKELHLPVHMHIHETEDEINQSLTQYGIRPLERLQRLELLSPQLLAVHMTQLTNEEIQIIAAKGAHIVHCPESNLKLANGFCPIAKLYQAGVNIALGTDSAASNNDLDMFTEMRLATLLAKTVAHDAKVITVNQALRMATLNGAKALGLEQEIGSLEIGKAADIIAIDLGKLETQPIYNPASQIVYAASRDKVSDVWIAGQQVIKKYQFITLDESFILSNTKTWEKKIKEAKNPYERKIS
ncbi:N-ethylammeline chlorohydrolase [Candidatus Nitrosoglobus terrae]|uniref:5-methylthioadenosine/S-adenosylhomocysteine deaminase n=1 Tax=Candidatus Nitrosoglobus terrae TaxID=1630141 RepID=A0A1Q2SLN8_9GAMM|nr:TRZ/ATZ family hydrolase [Candidatus Nitrosoglobus terrae]BAW80056.1 N-ethylammeline chlorohydrolase [Candidatus Nitrosoglobus terrae]